MDAFVATSGAWKKVTSMFVASSGVWKNVTAGYVAVGGVWKKFFPGIVTPTIEFTVTISRSDEIHYSAVPVVLTGTNYHWENTTGRFYYFQSSPDQLTWTDLNLFYPSIANPSTGSSNTVTYTLADANFTSSKMYFRFNVNGINSTYSTSFLSTSTAIRAVFRKNTAVPTISGTTSQGSTVSASTGSWNETPTSYVYAWQYYSSLYGEYLNIPGATSSSYSIPSNYIATYGNSLRVEVGAVFSDPSQTVYAVSTTATVSSGVPGAPTGLSATDYGTARAYNNGRIDLSWTTPSSNGGSAINGYQIERSTDGSNYSILVSNTGTTSTTYTDTGLVSSQIYYYRVSARNSNGVGSASSPASATATTVPQTPSISSVSRLSNTQVSLSFSGANGGKSLTSLSFTSSPSISLSYSGTSSPITITASYVLNQAYSFTMTASNNNGTSGTSSSSGLVTPYSATNPGVPQNLTRTTGNGLSKTFTWTAPSSDGGSPITGYEYSIDGGATYLPTSSSTSQSYTYSVGGSLSFRVRAVNAIGSGSPATLTFTLPNIYSGPSASSITSSSATISWSSNFQSSYSLSIPGAPSTPYTGTTGTSVSVTGLAATTTYTPTLTITSNTSDTHQVTGNTFTTGGGVVAPSNVTVTLTSYGIYGNDLFYPGDTIQANVSANGTTPFTYTYAWERSTGTSVSGPYTSVGSNSQTLATNSTYLNRWVRCTVTVTNSAGSASGTSASYYISNLI